jgi:hypothetical protein
MNKFGRIGVMYKRTPQNYRGTENPEKKLSELIPDFLKKLDKKEPVEAVFSAWQSLGIEKTEAISFVDGILTVKVKSSTLYSLLVATERTRLLKLLQEKFSIRNLVFRVG